MVKIKTARGASQIISSLIIDAETFRFINENYKKIVSLAKDLHISFTTDVKEESYMSVIGRYCESAFDPINEADEISDLHGKFLEKIKEMMREEVHEVHQEQEDTTEDIDNVLNFIKNIVGEIEGPAIIILKA